MFRDSNANKCLALSQRGSFILKIIIIIKIEVLTFSIISFHEKIFRQEGDLPFSTST